MESVVPHDCPGKRRRSILEHLENGQIGLIDLAIHPDLAELPASEQGLDCELNHEKTEMKDPNPQLTRLEAIIHKLHGLKRNGAGWMARCPSHEDRSPSLSIREADGRILLHCHAGCSIQSICDALGIRVRDLFNHPITSKLEPPLVREARKHIAGLRSRLTPRDREREVTIVLASESNLEAAMARALALAVEGELVQVVLEGKAE